MSQIIAGSLAAVTSFLLSAKIGIAGSVIGAAASYVISTLAANIYGTILKASGQKLQEVNPLTGNDRSDDAETSDAESSDAKAGDAGDETVAGRYGRADVLAEGRPSMADVPLPPAATRTVSSAPGTGVLPAANTSVYTVSELRGARRTKGRMDPKRMAVIVSVVSGLIGVALAAGAVMLFTNGHGTDTVVRDIVSPTTSQTTDDSSTQDTGTQGTQGTPASPDKSHAPKSEGTTDEDTTDDTGSDASSDSTSSGSSSNGTSGTDGSDSNTGSTSQNTTGANGSTGSDSGSQGTSGSTSSGSTPSGSSSNGTSGTGTSGTDGSDSDTGSTTQNTTGANGSTGSGSSE